MVILLFIVVTLLLLRNNHTPLHQSLNFVQSLSNYPRSGTILLSTTTCLLYTAGTGAVDIAFIVSVSIITSEAYSFVILNDSNHSNNILILFSQC